VHASITCSSSTSRFKLHLAATRSATHPAAFATCGVLNIRAGAVTPRNASVHGHSVVTGSGDRALGAEAAIQTETRDASSQYHALAVLTRSVVEAAHGWVASEGGVAAVMVVGVEPSGKRVESVVV